MLAREGSVAFRVAYGRPSRSHHRVIGLVHVCADPDPCTQCEKEGFERTEVCRLDRNVRCGRSNGTMWVTITRHRFGASGAREREGDGHFLAGECIFRHETSGIAVLADAPEVVQFIPGRFHTGG